MPHTAADLLPGLAFEGNPAYNSTKHSILYCIQLFQLGACEQACVETVQRCWGDCGIKRFQLHFCIDMRVDKKKLEAQGV